MFGILRWLFRPLRYLRGRRLYARGLYPFWDGQRERWVDPFRLQRELLGNEKLDLEKIAPFLEAGLEPEMSQALALICEAFQVMRWDAMLQTGLTDEELLNLLNDFADYCVDQKKSGSPGRTWPGATGSESSSSPAPPSGATPPSSDSASATAAQRSAAPHSSPGEPAPAST